MNKSYGKSDINLKLWIGLSRLNLLIEREIFAPFKEYSLTPVQFGVLEALYHKGELSIGEIRDSILTTSGNLTVVISNLEKKALVSLRPGQDRRVKLVQISQQGRELIEEVFPLHLQLLDKVLDLYSQEEKEELIRLFNKIRAKEE